ncbi:MAG TPA: MFS transporter [Steroidobacteraceae bacterium]|nr:MFS transporter [Steroidobacteraceae bacterium]
MKNGGRIVVVAWLVTSLYYFYQYMARSAPAVMMPQLGEAFGLSASGLATLLGLFYYAYSPFSLVAGVAMDQLGARLTVPIGAAAMGVGALMFASGDPTLASIGRFIQGAGGVFALIGAAFLATTYFPASRAATLIGATQMMGMAGGSAGQFAVGPLISRGLPWERFWLIMGVAGLAIAVVLFLLLPRREAATAKPAGTSSGWAGRAVTALATVFRNPQSWLCGLIAGLIFIPTTIFDMVWGVRFIQEGFDLDFQTAVMRSAAVPFGWIIGCPLLGWISDRIGRRKPVILASAAVLLVMLALILFGPVREFPPFVLGLVAGIASGGAMLTYAVIKEANRPEHSGTATGVINFINFSFSALLGPVFAGLLAGASAGGERELDHYQIAFQPLVWGVGLAIVLTFFLKETGRRAKAAGA